MRFLDGSPELTALVITLARSFRDSPFPPEVARREARRFSTPSPGGLTRERYDRLVLEGLVRCRVVEGVDGGRALRLSERALAFFRSYEARERHALFELAAEAGIVLHEKEGDAAPLPEERERESVFAVTRGLLEEVLEEAGLPSALFDEMAATYEHGKVYLSEDGGRYRFVLCAENGGDA